MVPGADCARRVLLIGYGNPGRRDDGLGPALAGRIEAEGIPGVSVESGHPLMLEDAATIARFDVVLFVDADAKGHAPYSVTKIEPERTVGVLAHSLSPGSLLALAEDHYERRPEAFLVGIRGYDFDGFGEGLTAAARENLESATEFVSSMLRRLPESP